MRFFTLGDLMVDVVATLDGPLVEGSDSPGRIRHLGGGSAANTAAWLAAGDANASFVGVVGDDLPGRAQRDSLQRAGVDPRLRVSPDHATGSCLVLVASSGERTMVPDPGANLDLRESDVPTADFASGDHLHVSGYALMREGRDAALHAMRAARAALMTVSVGAASSAPLADHGAQAFLAMVPTDALLFANEQEAAVLADARPGSVEVLTVALSDVAGCEVVVTGGPRPATWRAGNVSATVAASELGGRIVDSTGAGDAFAAGFLLGRAAGGAPADSLREGHALAARACRAVGGRPPL